MQHALTRIGRGGSPDAPEQHADHLPLEDQATRAVEIERGPPTEVAPTTVAATSCESPRPDHTGDEATVVTSRAGDLDPSRASAPTVADKTPPRTSRFTPLDEMEQRLADEDKRRGGLKRHLPTAGLGAALLAIVVFVAWAVWRVQFPSADALYRRLTTISRERGPREAKGLIDRFLERFPDDPRYPEVDDLRMDVECELLQKRLALAAGLSGGAELEPYERHFLEAMRLAPKQPQVAREKFQSLVDRYSEYRDPSPELKRCLEAANHQLRRLREARGVP
jgi:hypothetical protein